MKNKSKTYAFIDSQNLNLAVQDLGWKLDFEKLMVWLKDKFQVQKAFLFIGYVKENKKLYRFLKNAGYELIFKPTLIYRKSRKRFTKGNIDAELVLHAMIEWRNYDKAVIVSGDGDFYCLIDYWKKNKKLRCVIVPNFYKFSALLRKFMSQMIFLNSMRKRLSHNQNERH